MASQFVTLPMRVSSPEMSEIIDAVSIKALIASHDRNSSSAPKISRDVQKAILSEMEGLTKSMGSRITKIEASMDTLEQITKANQVQQISDISIPSEQAGLMAQLIALGKEVDALRRSVVLNSLIVIDLARRHDKTFPNPITDQVLSALGRQGWYTSPRLASLASRTRSMGRTILTRPGASHTKTALCTSEKCGICLNPLNSAITLPCSHRFCWNCLATARAHRHTSCPFCRAELSLDPREYVLDPVLFDCFASALGTALASDLLRISPISPKGVCRSAKTHSLDGIDMISPASPNSWKRGAAVSAIGMAPALTSASPALNPNAPEFSPSVSFTLPLTKSPLNRSAAAFVPHGSFDLGASATASKPGCAGEARQMSESGLPFRTASATTTLLQIAAKSSASKSVSAANKTGLIRYSIQTLMAMRPLNPLAQEFVPSTGHDQECHSEEEDGFSVWVNKRSSRHRKAQEDSRANTVSKDGRCGFADSSSRVPSAGKLRSGAVKL